MLRKIVLLAYCLVLLLPIAPVFAEELTETTAPSQIMINEIYANAPGSPEVGEFVELYNPFIEAFDLTGYTLSRKNTTFVMALGGLSIEPDSYLSVSTPYALINSGGTLVLTPPAEATFVLPFEVTYPSLAETESWSFVGETWQREDPTPGQPNPELPVEELPLEEDPVNEEEVPPAPPVCLAPGLIISEILANPAGADTEGGEFVELYNSSAIAVKLKGCLLTTDKVTDYELPDIEIGPGTFFAVGLADDLLNGGGHVVFIASDREEMVQYPELGNDEAWALIDDSWQTTELSTAGGANKPTPAEPENNEEQDNELAACGPGKFRNPETNRCKNIVETASSLLPCEPGEVRNPLTNRCRKATGSSSALTPCKEGQERNPATNRCRKIGSASKSLASCQPGYERNPDTRRCRKSNDASVAGAASFPATGPAPLHPAILASLTVMALTYGIYEYRHDLSNWSARLRNKFSK